MSVSFSIDKFKVNSAFDLKSELFFVVLENTFLESLYCRLVDYSVGCWNHNLATDRNHSIFVIYAVY